MPTCRRRLQGAWKPALNLSTVLTSVQLLMSTPNPDDGACRAAVGPAPPLPEGARARACARPSAHLGAGAAGLMADISHEYVHNYPQYERTARESTAVHATERQPTDAAAPSAEPSAAEAQHQACSGGASGESSRAGVRAEASRSQGLGAADEDARAEKRQRL